MKEVDKRARITVAYGGLVMLAKQTHKNPKAKVTRAQLFALPTDNENDPALVKAARTKSWQKGYIERLISAGLLTQVVEGGQEFYRAISDTAIAALIADHDNYGLSLSKFLFPHEAGMPPELLESEGNAEDEDEDTVTLKVLVDPQGGGGFADALGKAFAEPKEDESEDAPYDPAADPSYLGAIRGLRAFVDAVDAKLNHIAEGVKVVVLEAEVIRRELEQSQAEKEFVSYVKNRFKELDERLKKIENSTATTSRTLTDIDTTFQAFLISLIPNWVEFGEKLNGGIVTELKSYLHQEIQPTLVNIHTGIQQLWKRLGTVDSAKGVLLEFRNRLGDLRAVEDLAMKVIETAEKGDGDGS